MILYYSAFALVHVHLLNLLPVAVVVFWLHPLMTSEMPRITGLQCLRYASIPAYWATALKKPSMCR